MSDVVATLWGFCHTLRHDGIGYSHYVEQLTYLLFLKMAGEREIGLPKGTDWTHLRALSGTDLLDAYVDALRLLGRQPGMLADIFSGAQSRFTNPVNLKKLINLIDETDWTSLDVDVKAAAFEGLLEKAASEGKKGAGQYFTPRLLIKSIVRLMKPDPRVSRDFKIDDPACGTGGFLVASYEWLLSETKGSLDRDVAKRIRAYTYFGQDIDPEPRRLAVMNLYLHQVEPHIERRDSIYETPPPLRFDVVLTNPPFGTKGANQAPDRDDFTVTTSNKQLNFIQHVLTTLKQGGRAAVVVPDNVLFADQAGEVFKVLMEDCDVHTVLRLPRGTFSPYSEGTKTNVIFFTRGRSTERTWIYDARANVPRITKKDRPLTASHFAEFEACYGADPNAGSNRHEGDSRAGRWRGFMIDEVKEHRYKLDSLKWIRDEDADDLDDLPEPEELVTEATEELRLALDDLTDLQGMLEGNRAEAST
jgi:type I restriction enzyme M protein